VTNHSIAAHYGDWLDGLVIHGGDEAPDGLVIARTDTLMTSPTDRERVARAALELATKCTS
jgi:LPPG:FO 2-phospho-L-lactate transferase